MAVPKGYFEDYVALFPPEFQASLGAKLAYKKTLETEKRLKIPPRIWFAFLTPPVPEAEAYVPLKCKRVWQLKTAMLKALPHPKEFLDVRDPLHHSSERVTLALLETLYDLHENKVLLPEESRYREWLDVANHFGLWKLRYLLEDAIFKTFDPENFALFESVVQKQMFIDQHLILSIRGILEDALRNAGIKDFSIENRVKNIYGVYNKVAGQPLDLSNALPYIRWYHPCASLFGCPVRKTPRLLPGRFDTWRGRRDSNPRSSP